MARRLAPGGINTHVRFIGLVPAQRDFKTAGKRMRKQRGRDLEVLGRRMAGDVRGEMPKTLGVVSGDTRSGINHVVLTGRRDGSPFLIVGPSNNKGNLLRIHEEGLTVMRNGRAYSYPVRPAFERGIEKSDAQQTVLLGRSLDVV